MKGRESMYVCVCVCFGVCSHVCGEGTFVSLYVCMRPYAFV